MRMYDIIRTKRDNLALTHDQIRFFVQGYVAGQIPDYQVSALLMAVFLNGMNEQEILSLTDEMLHSGSILDWSRLPGRKVDKHSTGGVGDKTSLILAPLAAAAGVVVPMISGRGLGHTGGTLDKLESIPGFQTRLPADRFRAVLESCGLVLAGQTEEVAPADRKLYALRDVTATVESIPLIVSSILSKKLAEGVDALVFDVKFGSGAFMKKQADALRLARLLVGVSKRAGKEAVALLTDMDQPLGTHVGNSLEVMESVRILRGEVDNDLARLSFELAAYMLLLGRVAPDIQEARKRVRELVQKGAGLRKFQEVVAAQGGDALALEDFSRLPTAKRTETLNAPRSGFVRRIESEKVGLAAMVLGAGRCRVEDQIDPAVGLVLHRKVGEAVDQGVALATIYFNDASRLDECRRLLESAYEIGDQPPPRRRLIVRVID